MRSTYHIQIQSSKDQRTIRVFLKNRGLGYNQLITTTSTSGVKLLDYLLELDADELLYLTIACHLTQVVNVDSWDSITKISGNVNNF